jgi:hypothetical protein
VPPRATLLAALVLAGAGAAPARADGPEPSAQLTGVFVQGCMPFAGHPAALRAWAQAHKLPALPAPATQAFLHGAPGQAFDASAPGVKLALASSDDGICSVIAQNAHPAPVAQSLEAGLKQAGVAFRLVIDRDDRTDPSLHFREYLATRKGQSWRILAATVNDPNGGQAMLTAAPE